MIYKGFAYKRSSKPVMKGSGMNQSIEETRKEHKKLLEDGWGKTYRLNSFFKWWPGTFPEIWHY